MPLSSVHPSSTNPLSKLILFGGPPIQTTQKRKSPLDDALVVALDVDRISGRTHHIQHGCTDDDDECTRSSNSSRSRSQTPTALSSPFIPSQTGTQAQPTSIRHQDHIHRRSLSLKLLAAESLGCSVPLRPILTWESQSITEPSTSPTVSPWPQIQQITQFRISITSTDPTLFYLSFITKGRHHPG
jgi:hypothetical protein